MKLLEEYTCSLKSNLAQDYSNQKSAWKIKKTIKKNVVDYKFTNNYVDNELKSVCIHIVSERDLFLSEKHKNIGELLPQETFMFLALYLMQNEKKTKRLGLVIEAYWILSNEYLLIDQNKERNIQYFDVNDENILYNLETNHYEKHNATVFGISDSFMQAVKQCNSWEFGTRNINSKNKKISAIGLMKIILKYQLENKNTYFYYKDTALTNGLKQENIQNLINPRVILQINKVNPKSLRRVSVVVLRILDNLEQLSEKVFSPLNTVFVLQITGWDKVHKRQSKWIQTKKGNIYRNQLMLKITNYLYYASAQISKEKQSEFAWNSNYESILNGIESECGNKNWSHLKNEINKYGIRSKKIVSVSSQKLLEVRSPKKLNRYNNRLVQIEIVEQESTMMSNLLEEHEKNWKEYVYLSKVNNVKN